MWPWQRAPDLRLKVSVVVEPDDDGTFHAFCPGLPGLHADGRTEDEAFTHIVDALRAYLQSLAKHRDPLPIGPHVTLERPEPAFAIPPGAFLRYVLLEWPSLHTSGAN
jgi:antitoxin HicB